VSGRIREAWLEGPNLEALAARHGTPFYLYDVAAIRARIGELKAALGGGVRLLYAMKANPNGELLAALEGAIDGLDVASSGEISAARAAGFAPASLSFAGPGKTDAALLDARRLGIRVVVESLTELDRLVAAQPVGSGARARVMLRANPSERIRAFGLPMTGGPSPFGVDQEELGPAAERIRALLGGGSIAFEGLHVHPGAQCTSARALLLSIETTLGLAAHLVRQQGLPVGAINFGGGFGVIPGRALDLSAVGEGFRAALSRASLPGLEETAFELGRHLVAEAGVYVARVVSEKWSRGEHFVVLDGGLNHLFAATGLLGGPPPPVSNPSRPGGAKAIVTLVGPLCTPLDVLARGVELAAPEVGDLIVFSCAGAYGYTLSPLQFLGHPPPAEIVRE
jgi:diaminopimelate decarboxylase